MVNTTVGMLEENSQLDERERGAEVEFGLRPECAHSVSGTVMDSLESRDPTQLININPTSCVLMVSTRTIYI